MKRRNLKLRWWALIGIVLLAGLMFFKMRAVEADALAHAEVGRGVLACFGEYASALKASDPDRVAACYVPDFAGTGGARYKLHAVEEVGGAQRYTWQAEGRADGADGVRTRIGNLLGDIKKLQSAKLKLAALESREGTRTARVRALLFLRGLRTDGTLFQAYARFHMRLVNLPEGWRIAEEQFDSGDTVIGSGQGFADAAPDLGLDFHARPNPMYATPEWDPKRFGIFKYSSAGVSAGDYDGDGLEDLFFADGAAFTLYRNTGDGRFEDTTASAGLGSGEPGFNVGLFADFDNDGHRDLFLGGLTRPCRLYRNAGDGTFVEAALPEQGARPLVTVASAVDVDGDGDLDLYLGRYLDPRIDLPTTLFYTRNGAGNTLLRNDGAAGFTDITDAVGVREGGLTLGVAWSDIDRDGDPDLYVANDFGRNALLRNDGAAGFTDITAASGTLDFGFGMSADFGDVDGDGDPDLYVSNVRSSQRWYGQATTLYQYILNSIKQGTFRRDLPLYREIHTLAGEDWKHYGDRMVKGNSLFLNDGTGTFHDVAEQADANPLGWYWASQMLDYDNDGRLDLYAANGWITSHKTDDL